eukprot:TRINITY_DN36430_c0_g1_i1.p1 TRINITY_DN36430_c0_g1~~TRINITY_DN36430_c0_g1_i1.p1  ORF type:complete len:334 (-),score=39.80 TRINITY_DN36430_c0_g1_i1:74-1021(-)
MEGEARAVAFPVGSTVRLVGLQKADFNHHVGRVVAEGRQGRVGVALHQVVWPGASGPNTGRKGYPVDSDADQPAPISLKLENLRHIRMPHDGDAEEILALDCLPAWAYRRLLGEVGWGVPDMIGDQVLSYLRVPRVQQKELVVLGASSSRGDYPLEVVLNADESEWWISASGSCPGGLGREYLEFSLGPSLRRLSFIGLRIPPLPYGPLSVRDFHVLARRPSTVSSPSKVDVTASGSKDVSMEGCEGVCWAGWELVSAKPMQTLDRAGLQEFALVPPVETTAVCLVFTRNAASALGGFSRGGGTDCIGLFQVGLA